ncbi:SDR family NAD(P)-dependent oxidoreductase [Rhodococcus sp. NPDC004095]
MPEPSGRPVTLVTGASRGIGREIALAFAQSGFDVALTARTGREGGSRGGSRARGESVLVPSDLEDTAARVRAFGVAALPIPMDLLDGVSVLAAADRVLETWGRVDVLVNNAYVQPAGIVDGAQGVELDDATLMTRGNYRHQLALIQRVLPAMVGRGSGVVINLLSGPEPTEPAGTDTALSPSHATSNAAFRRLAAAVNAEYRHRGVRAFNLGPDAAVAEPGEEAGGDGVPSRMVARSALWLATQPAADRFLDNVVWVPKSASPLAA